MTEPQPVDLTAFLLNAEAHIREAAKRGTEGAGESLISAGCWYAPRLLAAVEAVLKLADSLPPQAPPASALDEDRMWIRQECADMIREAISRALLGEDDGLPSIPQILAWLRAHQWREGTAGPAGTLWLPPHGQAVGIPDEGEDRDLVRAALKRIAERARVPVAEVVREMRDDA